MDLGGSGWAPESKALQSLWSTHSIDQLPEMQTQGFAYHKGFSREVFVSLPLDKKWPYFTAFKADDGTCGIFEITKVKDRKIYIRYKTLNPPSATPVKTKSNVPELLHLDNRWFSKSRLDNAKWSEGKAMMGTLATAIRAWNAETQEEGSWTQEDLTYKMLGFGPNDLTGSYFSEDNFTWQVSYNKADKTPKFTIKATPGKGITNPAWIKLNHNKKWTKQAKPTADISNPEKTHK